MLHRPPSNTFKLEITTEIEPQNNTSLEVYRLVIKSCPALPYFWCFILILALLYFEQGLYKSTGNYCTQCEAEGFRKITFYQVINSINLLESMTMDLV